MKDFKSGFVAVIGRPNVGKSTLLNTIIGQKIVIATDKAQTTRRRIKGIFTNEEGQIVFIDTPGIHKPLDKLGEPKKSSPHGLLFFLFHADPRRLSFPPPRCRARRRRS